MKQWEKQFYLVLIVVTVLTTIVGFIWGVRSGLGVAMGATTVSLNFAVLILLSKWYLNAPRFKWLILLLFLPQLTLAPALLLLIIKLLPMYIMPALIGALVAATVSSLGMAVVGLINAADRKAPDNVRS